MRDISETVNTFSFYYILISTLYLLFLSSIVTLCFFVGEYLSLPVEIKALQVHLQKGENYYEERS